MRSEDAGGTTANCTRLTRCAVSVLVKGEDLPASWTGSQYTERTSLE